MRSKLFVPGTRAELFDKALRGAADAVSFDLEDSVLPQAKAAAREQVAAALHSAVARGTAALLIVRINAIGTPWFDDDLKAVAQSGVALINLPKAASAADVAYAADALHAAEIANGEREPIGLLVNIESAAALHCAVEIGRAHPRVAGLQLGLGDLFEPLGIDRRDRANVHATLFAMRMAAGAAGLSAWDGAYPDIDDKAGLRAEAQMARRLGFVGKSCIHPSQVAIVNEVFSPSEDELAAARRIVDAAQAAQAAGGHGAFVVDGRMVDAPFLDRARALVAGALRSRA